MDLKPIYEQFLNKKINISFQLKDGRVLTYHDGLVICITDLSISFVDSKNGAVKNFPLNQIIKAEEWKR